MGQGGHSSGTVLVVTPKTSLLRQADIPVSHLVPTIRAQSELQGWCWASVLGWPSQARQQAVGFG